MSRGVWRPRSPWGLPGAFWVIWVGILVLWTGRFVVPFLSTYLVSEPGLSVTHATAVVSAYGAGGVVASLLGGTLSDRIGRLPVLMVSFLGGAAMLLAIPLAQSALSIAAVLFTYGIVGHLGGPALGAMIADRVAPDLRPRAYLLQVWAMNLGFAIGPIVAVRLESVSFTLIFVVEAAVCVAVAVFLGRLLRSGGRFGPPAFAIDPALDANEHGRAGRGGYRRALADRPMLVLVALMLVFTVVYFQATSTLPIVMGEQGLSLEAYAALLTVNGALLCVLQVPAMRLIERVPGSVALAVGVGVTAIGYALQAVADDTTTYVVAVVTWTLGELATFPVAAAMVAALAPARWRGTYQGIYGLTWSGAHMMAPMLGGLVLAHAGSAVLWWGCAGLLAAVATTMAVTARGLEAEVRERRSAERKNRLAEPATQGVSESAR
ncbi:MFS transporter [Demequina litorisediminis]|uniref:MFS transporter n=1 Tax=Demequina litorisediminis TaxID=1849022 RepID=A0ABQ6IA44_9MICO|nr:MFS transporter [Demequina litorisediminis]